MISIESDSDTTIYMVWQFYIVYSWGVLVLPKLQVNSQKLGAQGCARFAEIWLKYFEFHILWSLSSVDFHTLTLQLPIQTQNFSQISAKRAHPWYHAPRY